MSATGISTRRGREADPAAPVDEDEPALAAALLDEQVDGDLGRVVGVVGLLEEVERAPGQHDADDRLAAARARDATERAVGVGAAADQRAVADAARQLAGHAAGGGGGRDRAVTIERNGADRAAAAGGRRASFARCRDRSRARPRIAFRQAGGARERVRALAEQQDVACHRPARGGPAVIGLAIRLTPATAPHARRSPSMIDASISTVPASVRTEPRPALKRGWSSSARTAASTASSARPSAASTRQPACTAARTPSRSSSSPSLGSAPAPPWTISVGTRAHAIARWSHGHHRVTIVVDCKNEARWTASATRIVRCRACPRLVAHREAVAAKPAAALRRPALLGAPAARLRRSARATAAGRAGAGRPRRQPHGSDVHRRPQRRLALRRASPRGLRQPADVRAPRRRAASARRLHHGHHPLRAARQQAAPAEIGALRALSAGGSCRLLTRVAGRGRARPDRLAGAICGRAGVWPWRRRAAAPQFGHGAATTIRGRGHAARRRYHPSQQNTFTGKLTRPMLRGIFERARDLVAAPVGASR